jgi:hypothetical protein
VTQEEKNILSEHLKTTDADAKTAVDAREFLRGLGLRSTSPRLVDPVGNYPVFTLRDSSCPNLLLTGRTRREPVREEWGCSFWSARLHSADGFGFSRAEGVAVFIGETLIVNHHFERVTDGGELARIELIEQPMSTLSVLAWEPRAL